MINIVLYIKNNLTNECTGSFQHVSYACNIVVVVTGQDNVSLVAVADLKDNTCINCRYVNG